MPKLLLFLLLSTVFLVQSPSVSAQTFTCVWSDSSNNCFLNNFQCPPPSTATDADLYCGSNFTTQPTCDATQTTPLSCSLLLTPTPAPPTPPPNSSPTPTPPPNCIPPDFPSWPILCKDIYLFACTGHYLCCSDPSYCPPPPPINPNRIPCKNSAECTLDWQGRDGSPWGQFDYWSNCDFIPAYNFAVCSRIEISPFCDADSGAGITRGLSTGLGCIPYEVVNGIVAPILTWAVRLAGAVAFLVLLYAAFILATSTGDPKRLGAGRELLVSALTGLLLVALSIVILNFLGISILGLGFLGFNV